MSELADALAAAVRDRLVRYASIDSQAVRRAAAGDPGRPGERSPSSPGQLELGRLLVEELQGLGLADAEQDDNGYVFATLPATVEDAPVIGLLAHLDTSPDAPGTGVTPLVHEGYDGGELRLPRGGTVLDPEAMPELRACAGHDLVTSSGDTLLGADDKAGMAEIMAAVAHLAAHAELPRPALRIGFTPDEEIGLGASLFDVARFGADCAYTLDGSTPGELQAETFSAVQVLLTIHGREVHTGWAKGKMVNATRLAGELLAALPAELTPERTEGREGFLHVVEVHADVARAHLHLIARDFDDEALAGHVALLRRTAEEVVAREPRARLEVVERVQYPNMRRFVEAFPEVVQAAEQAMRAEGVEPRRTVIRGGTDGSQLSAKGLPTPNLPTGGHEYHSVREWASVQEMAHCAATVVRLAEVWTTERFRGARRRAAAA